MRAIFTIVAAALIASAQPPVQTPPAGRGGGGGGRGGAQGAAAPVPSKSVRPTGSSLGMIRVGAADNNMWFGWHVADMAQTFKPLTWSEAAARSDALAYTDILGTSRDKVAFEIPKTLTYNLQPGEVRAVAYRLRELNQAMRVYLVDAIPADEASRRKLFEFAKALSVETIVTTPLPAATLADLDKIASDAGVNLAITAKDPAAAMAALTGRSKRLGVAVETGGWMQDNIKPVDGLQIVKDRLMVVLLRDRSALGPRGQNVVLGAGVGNLGEFLLAAFRASIKPLEIVVDASSEAELMKNTDGFEQKVMLPAMTARVKQMLDSPAGKIRDGSRLSPEMRAQIDAATPREAIVKPKKPRKMLITDVQMYSGHGTIPHANYLLEQMAKYTGAFEPTYSNDPAMLTYPKIKEFDAVFLNSVCGMTFPETEVREGILRYVREGGGIGGNHAVTFSNNHWPEYMDMLGAWAGAHHTEKQVIKVDDPNGPIGKMFGSASFEHTDEFYQMPAYSPYSREKNHVLLSIDVEKSDRATGGKLCLECTRPDQDYGLAWIKTYGKGRVYVTPLGHTEIMYTDKRWTQHLLAAIQFMLGDLDADTTPSAKLAKK